MYFDPLFERITLFEKLSTNNIRCAHIKITAVNFIDQRSILIFTQQDVSDVDKCPLCQELPGSAPSCRAQQTVDL